MLTAFVLSMAVAAPVPPTPPPVVTGPAPRLMELKATDGKVMVTVIRTEMVKVQVAQGGAIGPNGGAPAVLTREVPVNKSVSVALEDVKDLKVTTADGKKVEVADAVKKVASGAVVVISTDGKPVSPNYLKLFKDDVLVLVATELAGAQVLPGKVMPGGGFRPRPRPVPFPVQPAPPVLLPAQPGVIQIQIQPGQIQVLPVPGPAPVPAPNK